MKPTHCFYVPGDTTIIDTAWPDGTSSAFGHTLAEVQARYPRAEYVPWDDACRAVDLAIEKRYNVGVLEPSTKEQYHYALEVLPPCRWTRNALGEGFYVSELVQGSIADWYLTSGGRYWHAYNHTSADVNAMLAACLAS